MNDTPTPETDSRLFDPIEYMDQGGSCLGSMISRKDGDWVCSDFARKLERERDEAREQLTAVTEQRDEARKLAKEYLVPVILYTANKKGYIFEQELKFFTGMDKDDFDNWAKSRARLAVEKWDAIFEAND